MNTCVRCRDRLLDHVYGLLEGSDLQEIREHLDVCPECQRSLEAVQAEQKLLASAARAVTVVAEFALPVAAEAETTELPATVPMASAKPKRALWRRAWVGWTAAAAVLIAVSASLSFYRYTLHGYEDALADRQKTHKEAVDQFAALPAKYQAKQHAAIQELRTSAAPYLHVVGPTTLQPGAKAHLHITSHHVEGTPHQVKSKTDYARSDLRVKVVEAKTGKFRVAQMQTDDDGHALAELDASWAAPNSTLHVIVEAETGTGRSRLQETVQMLPPSYVTRIDTNKVAYQFKDVLFFRVLVLDHYTLLPPGQPIPIRVELLNPQGQAVRSLDMSTGAGGILAREFAIDDSFGEGDYTLSARPIDSAKTTVQAATQRLEIVRELHLPEFQLHQARYAAGDRIRGVFRGGQPLPKQAMINGQKVPMTSRPADAGGFGGGGTVAPIAPTAVKEQGRVQLFEATLPSNLPANANRVPIEMQFADGKKKSVDVPLAPTDFTIDFFPEGGDLIAGVQNRVFYRVRSKSGEPVTGEGQVMLMTGKGGVVDSSYQLGMGYLDFIPHPKETYTVRITTPAKIEVAAPFKKLGMRSEGVVIQIADLGDEQEPKAVGNQGDPIRLTLRQQGPARKLLLVAQCRGQVIDQRWVEMNATKNAVNPESVDVTLQPTQEATGMVRVTAYELQGKALQPVAERLVYRRAAQRLELGFALNKQQLLPGPVTALTSARDEKGQPAAAWVLASVVDERFQAPPRSLSAHFFLLNEIRTGSDLDSAQLILHDSAQSVQVLERFLGTHGWRRFVRTQEPPLAITASDDRPAQPLIFSREIMPADAMHKQYEEKVAQALTPIHKAAFTEQLDLEDQRFRSSKAVAVAMSNVRVFQEQMQAWIRISLATVAAGLLLVSLLLMGVGLYRIVRAHKIATPAFGAAFACLIVCIGAIFFGTWLGPVNVAPENALALGPPAWEVQQELNNVFAMVPPRLPIANESKGAPMSLHATLEAEKQSKPALTDALKDGKNAQALNLMARALAQPQLGEGVFPVADRKADAQARHENPAMNLRFKTALPIGKAPEQPSVNPPAAMALTGPDKGKHVEYFHQHVPNLQSDTLLWHPTLWLANGSAPVHFDFASGNATYRVLLLGHSPTGRFGFYETRLDVLGR